jgi:hypothetical protein
MESKLTKLAKDRSQLEYNMLSKESINWFQQKVRNIRNPNYEIMSISRERQRKVVLPLLGRLYFFHYDPKYADVLPYYDVFPLVLMLKRYNDGFLGLNLHYLPIVYRAAFLDRLMNLAVLNENDDPERVRISYSILTSSRKYKAFEPCLKRYLYTQMGSRLMRVEPNEWETALFLPVERFRQDGMAIAKNKVFKESIQKIRKG